MPTWPEYIDLIREKNHVDKAAIFGAAGDSVWAATPGYAITPAELQVIVASFTDTKDPKAVIVSGFKIDGKKYMTIRSDDTVLIGKKGKEGAFCYKTKLAVVVGHNGPDVQTPTASSHTEAIVNHLIKEGY